jgi:hypothetical protein
MVHVSRSFAKDTGVLYQVVMIIRQTYLCDEGGYADPAFNEMSLMSNVKIPTSWGC